MGEKEPTQTTKQGDEIPVPTRKKVERNSAEIAQPVPPRREKKHRKRKEDEAARDRARQRSGQDD
jgi:hypothetical protein